MHERTPLHNLSEKKFDAEQLELVDMVMNDVFTDPKLGLTPKNGVLSKDSIKKITETITTDFEGALESAGYSPGDDAEDEELTEGIFTCVKFGLLAPGHLMSQIRKDATGSREDVAQLCGFNHTLRDVIRTNPGIQKDDLEKIYTSMFSWGNIDKSFLKPAAKIYEDTVWGLEREIVFDQLARTNAFSREGIVPIETTIEEDVSGFDIFLDVPLADKDRIERVGIDVKASRSKVPVAGGKYATQYSDNFGVERGRVIYYLPLNQADLNGGFTLSPDRAESRATELIPDVYNMARALSQYNTHFNRNVGNQALR